jgi:uncharacterized surface protein with fasciclin (FAS1) repeats
VNPSPRTPRSHRPWRTRSIVAGLALLSLTAAACGDDESDSAMTEAPAATEAPAMTEAPDMTEAPGTTMADAMMGTQFGPACEAVPMDGEGSFGGMADDPAATAASNNPLLSTLVTAVSEAGLVDTLNGEGPFTIFAPTNDAFAAIPADQLEAILADKDLLTSILTYHVVAGESLDAAGLGEAGMAATVNGADLEFGADGTTVNDVDVVCSDVSTANATVHIIDEVLLPPDMMTESTEAMAMAPSGPACASVPMDGEGSFDGMADDPAATAASNNPVLSTLVSAVSAAGLVDTLNGEGPFTIFAPTNDAFAAIPAADLEAVLADTDLLTSILTYHVVGGESLSSADLIELGSVTTVNGADLEITDDNGTLVVNGVPSVCMDVPTANATVHIIGSVLMP